MSILHVKSDTIGDFTGTVTAFDSGGNAVSVAATDLVRPSDWNSVHNQKVTLTGNTFSNSTVSGTNIIWAGSGGVSVGGSGASVIISGNTGGGGGSVNFSAGTTSSNLDSVVFSNSNGVSFGLNGSTITGSVSTSLTNINVSAGTTSNNLSNLVFSNSNGVTFGLNGSTITATVQPGAAAGIAALGAGTQTATSGTVVFADSNGISFGMSGSTQVTASYTVPSTAGLLSAVNLSAGTTSNNLSAFVFSNSNNVSFGLSASTVTGSASFAQTSQSAIKAFGASNTGNTSGNTGVSTGINWVVAGSNRITINESTAVGGPNTLWIDNGTGGGAAVTANNWMNGQLLTQPQSRITNGSISIFPIFLGGYVACSDMVFGLSGSMNSAANTSSAFVDHSVSVVVYTLTGVSLSSVNSGSTGLTTFWQSASQSSVSGARIFNVPLASSTVFAPGQYWLAVHISTTNTATGGANTTALGASFSMLVPNQGLPGAYLAQSFGFGTAAGQLTNGVISGQGIIATAATADTIGFGNITESNGGIAALWVNLRNTSVF